MGGTCSKDEREEKCKHNFGRKTAEKKNVIWEA
jgi:hypothetical protein